MSDDDDSVPIYSPEEERMLTENLRSVTASVHRGDVRGRAVDVRFLQDAHAALFNGVRDHAGHLRARGYGQEWVTFGPQRSVHRDRVSVELEKVFGHAQRQMGEVDEASPTYELAMLTIAVRLHADIVRVHPFEDGNGRTSRLCLNHVLVKHGLRPIAIEAVKRDYTEALNHYYATADLTPLLDLHIQLYQIG